MRDRNQSFLGLHENWVLHRSFCGGGMEQWKEETGDQGAHKNVQETWLYIRVQEILLEQREKREDREKRVES